MIKLSGAEIIIQLLEKRGIEIIAGIPGGANLPLYNALYKSKIKHVLVRHEQAGGFIAQGMARTSGKTAVCFATSGPGATNVITAIADAKLDSIPVVCITGQVSTALIGTDAFQEIDTYGLTLPITKHNYLVSKASDLLHIIPEAFRIAESGRPGPVVVDVPKDVQNQIVEFEAWPSMFFEPQSYEVHDEHIMKMAEMIHAAQRPILYIGGGVVYGNACELVARIAQINSIPITSTLMGLGAIDPNNELFIGMLGMHGAPYTNYLISQTDLLIALGVRFDDRATGNLKQFCPNANVIHVDIDKSEINKLKTSHLGLISDVKPILEKLLPLIEQNQRIEWIENLRNLRKSFPLSLPNHEDVFHPFNLIRTVANLVPANTIITTDVGQHQMWVAQIYPFSSPRSLLTSGGLGTMGFGLPAAIGAALAQPDKTVICFSGDGSILMNIQELATLADLRLNVKIILMNNKHLGLVRQQQELFYNQNFIASKFITDPDFAAIGRAFGIKSIDLQYAKDPIGYLNRALSDKSPWLINVPIQSEHNVLPMVPPGAPNHEMIVQTPKPMRMVY